MPTCDTIDSSQPFYLWDTAYCMPHTEDVVTGIPMDSIFKPYSQPEVVIRKSMFAPSELLPEHTDFIPRPDTAQPIWLFMAITLLITMLLAYYRTRNIKIKELLISLIDQRAMERLIRDNNLGPLRLMPIGFFTAATMALAVHQIATQTTNIGGWLLSTLILAAAYFTRWGIMRVLGNIYESREAVSTYITSNYLNHLFLVSVSMPLLLLMVYLPWGNSIITHALLCLVALVFAARLIKGVSIFLTFSKNSSFYLFYYLCIVETAPVLIILKWLFEQ